MVGADEAAGRRGGAPRGRASSGRCWSSVPPKATLSSCMPRQMPSTGMSRSTARRVSASSTWSRSGTCRWWPGEARRRRRRDRCRCRRPGSARRPGRASRRGRRPAPGRAGSSAPARRRAGSPRCSRTAAAPPPGSRRPSWRLDVRGADSDRRDGSRSSGLRLASGPGVAQEVRSSARWTLPLAVLGSSAAKSTIRGYLYGAVSRLTWSWSSVGQLVAGVVAVAQDDDRADDGAALVVGGGDHGRLGHRLRARPAPTRPRTARSGSRPR